MHFVLAAGELSGDRLGAGLIGALRERWPDATFSGIAGPRMRAAGCEAWGDISDLSVMGITEVIRHLPRLSRFMRDITDRTTRSAPAAFIGIDAPDFNLRLARRVKGKGITTVQYVSPTVWAWREGRTKTLRQSCDLVLCILPFEESFLRERDVSATFIGHPLADEISGPADSAVCREELSLGDGRVIALLPGSRHSEIERHGPVFLSAAWRLARDRSDLTFVVPAATPAIHSRLDHMLADGGGEADVIVVDGQATAVLGAADIALVVSGTATLEAMLVGCPLIMAYMTSPLTAAIVRKLGLMKVDRYSLPNLLAADDLVEEILQEAVEPENLASAMGRLLDSEQRRRDIKARYRELADSLRRDAGRMAANSIADLLKSTGN